MARWEGAAATREGDRGAGPLGGEGVGAPARRSPGSPGAGGARAREVASVLQSWFVFQGPRFSLATFVFFSHPPSECH